MKETIGNGAGLVAFFGATGNFGHLLASEKFQAGGYQNFEFGFFGDSLVDDFTLFGLAVVAALLGTRPGISR